MITTIDTSDMTDVTVLLLFKVRDVLKGTLKPSSVFDEEEISIHDNHYHDDLMSSSLRQGEKD